MENQNYDELKHELDLLREEFDKYKEQCEVTFSIIVAFFSVYAGQQGTRSVALFLKNLRDVKPELESKNAQERSDLFIEKFKTALRNTIDIIDD